MKRPVLLVVLGLALLLLSGAAGTAGPVLSNGQKALLYVAATTGHPIDKLTLTSGETVRFRYLEETAWVGSVYDSTDRRWHQVTDDSKGVLSDYSALRSEDRLARKNKYSKLEPRLWDMLQPASETQLFPVAFWLRGLDVGVIDSQLEAQFPGLRVKEGRILNIGALPVEQLANLAGVTLDPLNEEFGPQVVWEKLWERFDAAYSDLLRSASTQRQGPLMGKIRGLGYEAFGGGILPLVAANLPKAAILEIAQHPDVLQAYFSGDVAEPGLDAAVPTHRANIVWTPTPRGSTGVGVKVAIVQENAAPAFSNMPNGNPHLPCYPFPWSSCIRWHPTPNATWPVTNHETGVGGVITSQLDGYKGMAPGVAPTPTVLATPTNLISAPFLPAISDPINPWPDLESALEWALVNPHQARIVTSTFFYNPLPNNGARLLYDDMYDWFARMKRALMVNIAGNNVDGSFRVYTPGRGYNVLTVGNFYDQGNPDWTDDLMAADSSWINPLDGHEKPEVVASGTNITTLRATATEPWTFTDSGTSFSAPAVAGLAALLRQADTSSGKMLQAYPEALRAIIMASALHNIEGPEVPILGQTPDAQNRDGAGGIDASAAEALVKGARWIGRGTHYPDDFDGNWLKLPEGDKWRFYGYSGQTIRVAIAWDSEVNNQGQGADAYVSELTTHFNLAVYQHDPWGQVVASSSAVNSWQIVQFQAPQTGWYSIEVYRQTSSTERDNFLGVAWMATPDYMAMRKPFVTLDPTTSQAIIEVQLDSVNPIRQRSSNNPVSMGLTDFATKIQYDPRYLEWIANPYGWSPTWDLWVQEIVSDTSRTDKLVYHDIPLGQPTSATTLMYRWRVSAKGCANQPSVLSLVLSVAGPSGTQIDQYYAPSLSVLNGDAKANGTVDMGDALFIAQYLVGNRGLGEDLTKVNALNASAPRNVDNPPFEYRDWISVGDKLLIIQRAIGKRDDCFNLVGFTSQGSQSGVATVEVGSVTLQPGQQAQVAVTVKGINDPDGLGGYALKITFDPAVVNITAIGGGQAPFDGSLTQNRDNVNGVVYFHAIYSGSFNGPTSDIVVDYLTIQAVGQSGSSTTLDLSITDLIDTFGDTIPAVDSDGTVTIQ